MKLRIENESVIDYEYEKEDVIIPEGVTRIDDEAFYSCICLTSITIPDSVTSIGCSAFGYCESLPHITIPEGVRIIGAYAFEYCSSLESITIPNSVTSIGSGAFYGCDDLVVQCKKGSYAELYCFANGIRYEVME